MVASREPLACVREVMNGSIGVEGRDEGYLQGRGSMQASEEGHSVEVEVGRGVVTSNPRLESASMRRLIILRIFTFLIPLMVKTTSSVSPVKAMGAAIYPSSALISLGNG